MPPEPLVVELTPPPDPWEVARRFDGATGLLFLDSAAGPRELTLYSYLTALPFRWITDGGPRGLDPFGVLQRDLAARRVETIPDLPPFQGGAAGLFGYGLCHWLERVPRPLINDFRMVPDLAVGLYDWVIAWDHRAGRAWIISTGMAAQKPTGRPALAKRRLSEIRRFLDGAELRHEKFKPWPDDFMVVPSPRYPLYGFPDVYSNFSGPRFKEAIRRAIEYTHAGDCFQVNLAQRLVTPQRVDAFELYGRLRRVNPAPFAAYFDAGYQGQIASASPERFLKMSHDGQIETRPIKGTRPRGYTPEHDAALHGDLLVSEKDRAENVMIVDLLRNDLGRVCEYGSVQVTDLCRLESYPTVHHLVSEVRGQLRQGLTAVDLLKAAFPGGSVTGAPKVRAMEIIAELEPHARGPYCGSLGWIGFDGAMDTNILIRTFTAAGGWLQFPVGGGIVADSDPAREYEETLHKAAGLLRALD